MVLLVGAVHDRMAVPEFAGGAPLTVTIALCDAEPPLPLQVRVNLVEAVRVAVACDPSVPCAPLHPPDAVQVEALLDDQLSVDFAPLFTALGLALRLTVGGEAVTVTVADCVALPPLPLQLKV